MRNKRQFDNGSSEKKKVDTDFLYTTPNSYPGRGVIVLTETSIELHITQKPAL